MGDSTFNDDDVGPCNVIKKHLKCLKILGAVRGMCFDPYNCHGTVV
jgi:hypothetical protein